MARADRKSASADEVDIHAAPGSLESGEKPENFASDPGSDLYREAEKFYELVRKQYDNQQERADATEEFWNIYNAKPDANQQYSGNSQCYVPAVRDAINARVKRRLKQLFPTRHRHVEAVGDDPETPWAQLALLEHYIRETRLKSIIRSVLVAGDVTGQLNLYVDWSRSYRRITETIRRNPILENDEIKGLPDDYKPVDPSEEEDGTEETDVIEEGPEVIDFADEDLAVVPPTVNDIEKAYAVALRLRMSKEKVRQMVEEGVFDLGESADTDALWDQLEKDATDGRSGRKPPDKQRASDAGLKTEGTFKYLLVFWVTARLSVPGEDGKPVKRLCDIYYASKDRILGILVSQQWGGKRQIISAPIERVQGAFKGISKIEPVKFLQWNLNDYWNMGQDSAMYSLLPITMTDPLSNPNYASMVIGLAAVWSVDPNKTKFATMPQLYKEAIPLCDTIKRQIWESMDVNEMMMGRMPAGRKNNQLMGQMQQEQMTNILDDAEYVEEVLLDPLCERIMEYDRQFRTAAITVIQMGEIGMRAKMTEVAPQQFGKRYAIQWTGTRTVQSQQLMQMQIAFMNVLRGIPPQQLAGRRVDVTPIIEKQVEALFGPEVAPKILVDERNLFTIDPNVENEMLLNGLPVDVHEADNDQQHIGVHMSGARMTSDPTGKFRAHIAKHTMKMQMKAQMMMGQQQGGGAPGVPGPPAGAGPGVPGSPRMGASPAGPRPVQGPPGLPHPDQAAAPGRG